MPGGYVGGRPKDSSKLSRNPAQIRNRLRRKQKTNSEDFQMYTELVWKKPIEEWDNEELARGRPRDKNGKFVGKSPSWATPAIAAEAKRRLMTHTFGKLAGHIDQAVVVIGNLLVSEEVDDKGRPIVDAKTKLAAATFIIEHTLGKPKALIELTENETTKTAIAAAIVLEDGAPQDAQHRIIDGELADDEEEEYEDDGE